jgi:hypothetical protein
MFFDYSEYHWKEIDSIGIKQCFVLNWAVVTTVLRIVNPLCFHTSTRTHT